MSKSLNDFLGYPENYRPISRARRRRCRWTVTCRRQVVGATAEKQVILAYTAEQASGFYERRGYMILDVRKGDFRTAESNRPSSERPWSFNMPAIREAFEAMTGKPLPEGLKFEYGRANANRYGVFEWRYSGPNGAERLYDLTVRVRRTLSAEQANRTLWHELAHVAQFVRCPSEAAYLAEHRAERRARHGYKNRPCEIEAREWEVLADTDNLLNIR